MTIKSLRRSFSVVTTSVALLGAFLMATPANAETPSTEAALPETVTADALPTVQVEGIVWDQEIVGNTVYAGGQFSQARPAGAARGQNTVARHNVLAYDLVTGALKPGFVANTNAQVKGVAASGDGKTVYIAGSFTQVNGQTRYRFAALDAETGAVKPLNVGFDSTINTVAWTPDAIYLGGAFSKAKNDPRQRAAAIHPDTGAVLPFNPNVGDGQVQAIVTNPEGSKVVLGGSFTKVNNNNRPGLGIVMLDPATGKTHLPLAVNNIVRNGGTKSAIMGLDADADGFYAVGYQHGDKANPAMEGSYQADWNGNLVWLEDCHGDSYDIAAVGDVVYTASHKHYCGNLGTGGFPQVQPNWTYYRGTAATKFATGLNKPDVWNYNEFPGTPSNTLLNWFPELNAGTFTGLNQGPWDVEANDEYVVMGGEFTRVNFTGQEGLVRFAVSDLATNKQGPRVIDGKPFQARARSQAAGVVRVSWNPLWDMDDATLTYSVYREGTTDPIHEASQTARFWEAVDMGFTDKGRPVGSTQRYQVVASDPSGNKMTSPWVSVTVSGTGTLDTYADTVLSHDPSKYWRLNEPSGRNVFDWAGIDDTQTGSSAKRNQAGALLNSSDVATSFGGTNASVTVSKAKIGGPDNFSVEAWFKTSSGGKILGFGSAASGDSSSYDRSIWVDGDGRVNFGVYTGSQETIQSGTGYKDNQWHHAVGTLSSAGMALYVDGKRIGTKTGVTSGQSMEGYWRIGGDKTWSGNKYFNGVIDEFAVYPRALTLEEIDSHWKASGRSSNLPTAPGDAYGASVFNDDPEFFWRLDETSGNVANDSSWGTSSGNYLGENTKGGAGAFAGSKSVNLREPVKGFLGIGAKDGGNVISNAKFTNPTVFSQEVWIRTTATTGGRIMGFGDSNNKSASKSADRMLQLLNNGRVRFGVYPGSQVVIDSTTTVNDGQWHHLVSTLGPDGMKLYVDGTLEASDPNTQAQNYAGWWRLGGDKVWTGSSNEYLPSGDFDEAAVYSRVLTLDEVQDHYEASGRTAPNTAPVAVFSSTVDELEAHFDSTGSYDAEGAITYAWNFGDGATSTKKNPSHTYTASGTYTVTLTVKDSRGATATATDTVSVLGANEAPTAGFTHEVDGLDVSFTSTASDPDGSIVAWAWDFGDGATSTQENPSHTYTTGAVRTVTLTVTDDRGATATVSHEVDPDEAPVADFVVATHGLRAVFSSASTDDGAIVSQVWNFGDGSGSMQTNPVHDYAVAGDYTVTLTVTDNTGNVATKTTQVSVAPAPNQPPTASFTYQVTGTEVAFDGRNSSDVDGSVSSWAWDFGDGNTATGSTPVNVFADGGTYTVTLTVTDDEGAVDVTTRKITIVIPQPGQEFVKDDFGRTVVNSWGTADVGGPWTVSGGAAAFAVESGQGTVTLPAGGGRQALLGEVASDEADVTFDYTLDKTITGGGNSWLDVIARQVSSGNSYRAKVIVNTSGEVRLDIVREQNGSATNLGSTTVPGLTVLGGETMKVRVRAVGNTSTDIGVKVWKDGTEEPAEWQHTRSDSTAELQVPGAFGFYFYLSGSVSNAPQKFRIDNLRVKTEGVVAPNQEPIADFSAEVEDAVVQVNGGTSVDPDGSLVSWAWNFGDGKTATGVTAAHTYRDSGDYDITLTVTDNSGATASVTKTVSVTVPADPDPVDPDPVDPDPQDGGFVEDNFDRTVTNGWGDAVTGGVWTTYGGSAAPFSVADGSGKVSLTAGGGRGVSLNSIEEQDVEMTFDYSLSRAVAGGNSFLDVVTRQLTNNDSYRAKVLVSATGAVRVDLARVVGGVSTTIAATNVNGLTVDPNETLKVKVRTIGTAPTTLQVKVWKAGEDEPVDWSLERTDTTAALQTAGAVGFYYYLSGTAGAGAQVFSISDLLAVKPE